MSTLVIDSKDLADLELVQAALYEAAFLVERAETGDLLRWSDAQAAERLWSAFTSPLQHIGVIFPRRHQQHG